MKCQYCNGTGEHINDANRMTTCEFCGGTGICELGSPCPHQEPLTNEEWFNGLATEEKAKRIINIAVNSDCDYRTIVEWLKQPHNSPK